MVDNPQYDFSVDMPPPPNRGFNSLDEDGRSSRTGTVWTASAHITTAVIGSGVLSLAWATSQLGWAGAAVAMLLFSATSYYTSCFLASCYRTAVTGRRNYTYMDAVNNILGGVKFRFYATIQYVHLFGVAVGYGIACAISMRELKKSNKLQTSGGKKPERVNINPYIITFGLVQIIVSQVPRFDQLWWILIISAVIPILYSSICIGLGIAKIVANGSIKGSLTGVSRGEGGKGQKICRILKALDEFAFTYSCSNVFFEIEDTLKSPPSEEETMKKASLVSVGLTTLCFMLCGSVGYAAFGDMSPNNLLTGFVFYNPYWLVDLANAAVVVHLVREYQVTCRPIFAFIEKQALVLFPASDFIARDIKVSILGFKPTSFNRFRLIYRTVFVIITTVTSMHFPFFNDVIGLVVGLGFWPLTVYFPVEMYIKQKNIPKWSTKWVCLQLFSLACLVVSLAAVAGSVVAGFVFDVKPYKLSEIDY